jgi:hypothetical protein
MGIDEHGRIRAYPCWSVASFLRHFAGKRQSGKLASGGV